MGNEDWNDVLKRIKDELSVLVRFVDKTRTGLDSLQTTVKLSSEKFPEASRQLSAVAGELENAANNIIALLENLLMEHEEAQDVIRSLHEWAAGLSPEEKKKGAALFGKLEGISNSMKKDLMEIFSSLSFQDLTGQKLKKVVEGLSIVESKLLELAINFDFNDTIKLRDKKAMLNELKEVANEPMKLNQDVVDKILKELGA
ncbi:MAG: protein phosphatase CheZ [Deltaproteobacteria bacterium]|nr:protein phosphatase CheZ [Deltaproteobacteria bacterium]